MLIKLCKRRGQNTAEYAILIGVIVAAAIAMQVYVRRGMQARVKDAVDYTQTANEMFTTPQYEPYYTCSSFATTSGSASTEAMQTGGAVTRNSNDSSNRSGAQAYTSYTGAD